MPKYYCDYCDTFLTHDSTSVRKSHIDGVRHQAAVRAYYAQLDTEHQEAPDREAMRYEKMKDDAMQFMMLPMPMGAMGGFPPMLPPPNFMPSYSQYGAPPPQNNAPRYDNRGPPRRDDGWNDRRGTMRQDGRGPQGEGNSQNYAAPSSEPQWDGRKDQYADAKADQSRGYVPSGGRDDGRGPRNDGYGQGGSGSGYAAPSQSWR